MQGTVMASNLVSLLSWSHLMSTIAISSAFCPPRHPPSRSKLLHQYSPVAANTIDVSENAPRDIASLSAWAAEYGIQTSDCFELVYGGGDDGTDVYAATNRNLSPDEPIVCVPAGMMMTGGESRREVGAEAVIRAEQALMLSDHASFHLFLKVLREHELGEASPWHRYLNSLPRYYSNGSSMTDFCFGCLPPYAAKQAREEKNRLKRFELALDEVSFLGDATKKDSALVEWAFNAVHTRYQEMPSGDYALIPMVDMFNHGGADADAYITYDGDGNCYAYSSRDVPAGEPLKICYGDPTNPSKLLARYGFLDESSSATYCKWIADEPSSELFQLGYPNQMLFYNDGSVSNAVWDCLLYEELGNESPAEQQEFHQACMISDESTKAGYHEQYFPQTLTALREHVAYILNELDELGTWQSTVQDKERHTNLDERRHPRLPLIKRHNEFVKRSFELVQQNLDAMF